MSQSGNYKTNISPIFSSFDKTVRTRVLLIGLRSIRGTKPPSILTPRWNWSRGGEKSGVQRVNVVAAPRAWGVAFEMTTALEFVGLFISAEK